VNLGSFDKRYLGNNVCFPALEREQQLVRAFDFVFGL
jgi:hypothetical protein